VSAIEHDLLAGALVGGQARLDLREPAEPAAAPAVHHLERQPQLGERRAGPARIHVEQCVQAAAGDVLDQRHVGGVPAARPVGEVHPRRGDVERLERLVGRLEQVETGRVGERTGLGRYRVPDVQHGGRVVGEPDPVDVLLGAAAQGGEVDDAAGPAQTGPDQVVELVDLQHGPKHAAPRKAGDLSQGR
jgi:hypothetical protein